MPLGCSGAPAYQSALLAGGWVHQHRSRGYVDDQELGRLVAMGCHQPSMPPDPAFTVGHTARIHEFRLAVPPPLGSMAASPIIMLPVIAPTLLPQCCMVSVHQVDLACDEAAYLQSVTPVSSAYVAPATVPWVYDNATSISITPHLSELEHVEILATPFQLGGIGVGQLTVTNRGLLWFLPVPLSVCYYSAQATSSLVSLGFLQTQGCGLSFRGVTNSVLTDPAGAVLDVPMLQSNLLTTVSTSRYNAGRGPFSDPALSMVASPAPSLALPTAHSLIPLYPTLVVDELLAMVAHLPLASKTGLQLRRSRVRLDRIPFRLLSMLAPFQFMTKEQRARCERVELVHYLTHAGDDALCQALDGGAYQWANVTSADVRPNRKWRGSCVACLQGFRHSSCPCCW